MKFHITIYFCLLTFFCCMGVDKSKILYVKSKYEHIMFEKEHLFYPAKKAKRLLIFFSGATKNKYAMWSWFWRDDEAWPDTAYLFLKDDDFCWYIGNNKKDFIGNYSNIINHYISVSKLKKDKVFTIGGSMGGYGAILYATILGLKGTIAIGPQVNKLSNKDSTFALGNTENRWQDLEKIVTAHTYVPNLSLVFSYYPADESAGYALIEELKRKVSVTIIRRHPSSSHIGTQGLTKKFIEQEIAYLEKQSPIEETKSINED